MSVTITTAVSVGSILSEPTAQLLAVLGTAFLIGLLAMRAFARARGERLTGRQRAFARNLSRAFGVAIPAMLFVFGLVVGLHLLGGMA